MGPVQEKETITSVNAINNILTIPEAERAFLSKYVDHEAGNVISNSPKNDNANTTNSTKKNKFSTAFVAIAFSADAPKIAVTSKPKPT